MVHMQSSFRPRGRPGAHLPTYAVGAAVDRRPHQVSAVARPAHRHEGRGERPGRAAATRERRGVPRCVISSPASGGTADAARNCAVFCTPRARPGPERSGPLGDGGERQPVVGDGEHGGDAPSARRRAAVQRRRPAPRAAIVAAAASATQRSGRIRLADHVGEVADARSGRARRATWAAATRTPAAAGDQPRSCTSQTSAKVQTRNCGTTSSTETPWTRARKRSRR